MIMNLKKTTMAALAALSMAFAVAPIQSAEAQYYRNGWVGAGIIGGALLGGALLSRQTYAAPVYYGSPVYYGNQGYYSNQAYYGNQVYYSNQAYGRPVYVDEDCRVVRRRVWSEQRGRYVQVRRTVCD